MTLESILDYQGHSLFMMALRDLQIPLSVSIGHLFVLG